MLELLRWRVLLDEERTRRAYSRLRTGGAVDCGCAYCRNYLAQRNLAFPRRARELLERLAVPFDKDLEVVEYGPATPGGRQYGAWFYFAGELVSGRDCFRPTSRGGWTSNFDDIGDGVSFGLTTRTAYVPEEWQGFRLVMVEANFSLPWVLEEPPG